MDMEQESPTHAGGVADPGPGHVHAIHYFVDAEEQTTTEAILTVEQILTKAGLDPASHYLIELRGDQQIPHQNLNEQLRIHEKERFISVFSGPTPLSLVDSTHAAR